MDDRQYKDIDGNPIHLNKLCRREPEWAANQVRHRDKLKARLAALEEHMDGIKDYTEACNDRGIPMEEWLDRARQIIKGA